MPMKLFTTRYSGKAGRNPSLVALNPNLLLYLNPPVSGTGIKRKIMITSKRIPLLPA